MGTVIHVAPHPDDESLGAPATLMALRDSGWSVINFACSLGSEGTALRRRAELVEACKRARFELVIADRPVPDPLPAGDMGATHMRLVEQLAKVCDEVHPDLIIAPSPHDRHPGHEVVGSAVVELAGTDAEVESRVWLWGLWGELPFPTLLTAFDHTRLEEMLWVLEAHASQLTRNDYRRVVRGRARMTASLGPERAFGFGAAAPPPVQNSGKPAELVELLCEIGHVGGSWRLGVARWLEPDQPLRALGDRIVDDWLTEQSITARFGPP